jgi:hypothetical protein
MQEALESIPQPKRKGKKKEKRNICNLIETTTEASTVRFGSPAHYLEKPGLKKGSLSSSLSPTVAQFLLKEQK